MREIIPNANRSVGITLASIGVFVVGCVYNQPEVAVPGLLLGGVGILKLATNFVDYIDTKNNLIAEANEIIADPDNPNFT